MHRDVYTAQLLAGIEQAIDVNQFMVGNTSVWGLFRTLMYFPLREALERDRVSSELAQRLHDAFPVAPRLHSDVVANVPSAGVPTFPQGPVAMLAAGPTHTTVSRGLHESPIADAWVRLLQETGIDVVKLDVEPSWFSACQPRRIPSGTVPGPRYEDELAAADEVGNHWVPVIEQLFVAMELAVQRTLGISLAGVLEPFLERVMGFVAQRLAADRWLRALQPRAVFMLCYYETCYLPVISAARSLGIPTADLQHGMNGTMHAAYTHFTVLPPDGYDVLPDYFLTWGQLSSENITRWWNAPTRHLAVVAGRWDIDASTATHDNAAGSALTTAVASASTRIVVTMQDEPFDAELLAAMRSAPNDWVWLVRPHPASARYPRASAAALSAQIAEAKIANAVVVDHDVASLADLLQQARVHVTWASSSWLDAAVFGVPTVFVHPGAGEQFSVELALGVAYAAPGAHGLLPLVRQLVANAAPTSLATVVNTSRATAHAALRQLGLTPRDYAEANNDSSVLASASASEPAPSASAHCTNR